MITLIANLASASIMLNLFYAFVVIPQKNGHIREKQNTISAWERFFDELKKSELIEEKK